MIFLDYSVKEILFNKFMSIRINELCIWFCIRIFLFPNIKEAVSFGFDSVHAANKIEKDSKIK